MSHSLEHKRLLSLERLQQSGASIRYDGMSRKRDNIIIVMLTDCCVCMTVSRRDTSSPSRPRDGGCCLSGVEAGAAISTGSEGTAASRCVDSTTGVTFDIRSSLAGNRLILLAAIVGVISSTASW